jgi:hypothetical protein
MIEKKTPLKLSVTNRSQSVCWCWLNYYFKCCNVACFTIFAGWFLLKLSKNNVRSRAAKMRTKEKKVNKSIKEVIHESYFVTDKFVWIELRYWVFLLFLLLLLWRTLYCIYCKPIFFKLITEQ